MKIRQCIICNANIPPNKSTGVPTYYRVVNKIYNWYCGIECSTHHHQQNYVFPDEVLIDDSKEPTDE